MFTGNSQISLFKRYIPLRDLVLFIFCNLEKNWTSLLHSVSGKRGPLAVAGSCWANELERAAGLQSEAALALCSCADGHTSAPAFVFLVFSVKVLHNSCFLYWYALFRDAQKTLSESFLGSVLSDTPDIFWNLGLDFF